ncbi:hypothetical protein PoB_001311700 [Plakobranchus ocellatus]|uniref:Uncharacterized protein n=1 Tax=Plakobranchus ocellatus TaxID=259542 RepID=A0AAV3YUK2_9GAST|nr:hypothetical protein PoB_001311700 [Plakobranchus ocellatus]
MIGFSLLCIASRQQGDLRLSGPLTGQGAGGGARTRDRRIPADLRADSLATVPPTPLLTIKQVLSGPPSGQGAGGEARTRDKRVPADLRADSLATEPPTPLKSQG